MSHFAVIVVTNENPEESNWVSILDKLKPFHEFESTGLEFGIGERDNTEDCRKVFDTEIGKFFVFPDGTAKPVGSNEFYRPVTDEERAVIGKASTEFTPVPFEYIYTNGDYAIPFEPEGAVVKCLPCKEVHSFEEFLFQYYGISTIDEGEKPDIHLKHKYHYAVRRQGEIIKVVRRTNINKYRYRDQDGAVLGEFSEGAFPVGIVAKKAWAREQLLEKCYAEGREINEAEIEREALRQAIEDYSIEIVGGTFWDNFRIGGRYAHMFPGDKDSIRVAELNISAMLAKNVEDRRRWWKEAEDEYNKNPSLLNGQYRITRVGDGSVIEDEIELRSIHFDFYSEKYSIEVVGGEPIPFEEARRRFFEMQGAIKKTVYESGGDYWDEVQKYPAYHEMEKVVLVGRIPPEFITLDDYIAAASPISAFAYVKDGVWRGKGRMGWFGRAALDTDERTWRAEVLAMLGALPPDSWVTMVNCHI